MPDKPDPIQEPSAEPSAEDDTQGHSLSLVMGLSAMDRTRERARPRAGDDELPPITKTFPRLRAERPKDERRT